MYNYEVIGFREFVSKKGIPMFQIYTKFIPQERLHITGEGCEIFFCAKENLNGTLSVGCDIDIRYGRNNFIQSIDVL